jgi:uncharacterized protein (TIGR02001 family)
MKFKHAAGAFALMMAATAAQADELSATVTAVSDYDFRGISNSARDPALQGSLDYSSDHMWYAGIWASTIDFGPIDTDIEADLILGLSGGSEDTVTWDLGVTYYAYLGESDLNYPEFYVGLDRKFTDTFSMGGKFWYSQDYAGVDESASYLEVNGRFELPKDFGLEFHVGRSDGDYWDAVNGDGYTDYAIGLTYSYKGIDFGLKYVDGSDLPDGGVDLFSTESKVLFTIGKTFSIRGGE